MKCPNCTGSARILETRRNVNGNIRRQITCRSCNYSWLEWMHVDPAAISCLDCIQWSDGRCTIGLPEPEREGLAFAKNCSVFQLDK